MKCDATAIILAGGKSRRMHEDKRLLPWAGKTLLEHIIDRISIVASETFVVFSNPPISLPIPLKKVKVLLDREKGIGPMMGLYTGLEASQYPFSFAVACDLPFLTPEYLSFLYQHANHYDVVVPRIRNRWHPLSALYRKSCLCILEKFLQHKRYALTDFLEHSSLSICSIDESSLAPLFPLSSLFMNINTFSQYQEAKLEYERAKTIAK